MNGVYFVMNFCDEFLRWIFVTCNILTIASFRIGVPWILFFLLHQLLKIIGQLIETTKNQIILNFGWKLRNLKIFVLYRPPHQSAVVPHSIYILYTTIHGVPVSLALTPFFHDFSSTDSDDSIPRLFFFYYINFWRSSDKKTTKTNFH